MAITETKTRPPVKVLETSIKRFENLLDNQRSLNPKENGRFLFELWEEGSRPYERENKVDKAKRLSEVRTRIETTLDNIEDSVIPNLRKRIAASKNERPSPFKLTQDQILGVYILINHPATEPILPEFNIVKSRDAETIKEIDSCIEEICEPEVLKKAMADFPQSTSAGIDVLKRFAANRRDFFLTNGPTITRLLLPFVYVDSDKMKQFATEIATISKG